jgi:hypothetical protein
MKTMGILMSVIAAAGLQAADLDGKKVCECPWVENPPEGVWAWAQSERVATGKGRESRFVPYNSEAAKGLILDATALREVYAGPANAAGFETSFYTIYDERGWFIYIQCQDPDVQKLKDDGKDIALEVFFTPGMQEVPYYQIMVAQLPGKVEFVDWGMPHRNYRSLKGYARVESLPIKGGVATCIFIPWEAFYDRLPLNGESWRFSLMRWKPSVTWGGNVHDTGNFGLVRFEKPLPAVREAIEKRVVRSAWGRFQRSAARQTAVWSDAKVGDPEFSNGVLKPAIEQETAFGAALGKPEASWDAVAVKRGWARLQDWMEFDYKVAELRTDFLMDKRFKESNVPQK